MRVEAIVRRVLDSCRGLMHAKRIGAVLAVVAGIVRAGRLSVTSVGRALPSRALVKHSIKRVDRLLSNSTFQSERWIQFAAIARFVLGSRQRPIIIVDWTKVVGDFHALYAAVPFDGRAQTVYLEVHPERRLESAQVHKRFLRSLKDVLSPECRPIVVSDAGFHGPFFREVQRLGWDYVGRVRGRTTMRADGVRSWTSVRKLYRKACRQAEDLGGFRLYKKVKGLATRLILLKKDRSGRHPWTTKLSADHASTMTGAKDPWLLATSLQAETAVEVARIYGTRMQIEEVFRDAKNHRFGWSLRDVRSNSETRLAALLLLGSLAMLAVTLIGMATEFLGIHRQLQANTAKKRVLSLFVLGAAVLRANLRLPSPALRNAFRQLRNGAGIPIFS